jgi:hypothetical protein
MDFEVLFTIDATNEAAQMSRSWTYWPRFVFQNLQGIVVVVALLIGGCVLLAENFFTRKPDLPKSGIGLLLVAAPIVVFWWLRRRDIRKATQMLAEINPLKLNFDSDGLHTFEKNGASNFVPWSSYDGFREGKRVILLRESGTRQYRVIPKNTVPESDVERIRSAVRSRLPEIH